MRKENVRKIISSPAQAAPVKAGAFFLFFPAFEILKSLSLRAEPYCRRRHKESPDMGWKIKRWNTKRICMQKTVSPLAPDPQHLIQEIHERHPSFPKGIWRTEIPSFKEHITEFQHRELCIKKVHMFLLPNTPRTQSGADIQRLPLYMSMYTHTQT